MVCHPSGFPRIFLVWYLATSVQCSFNVLSEHSITICRYWTHLTLFVMLNVKMRSASINSSTDKKRMMMCLKKDRTWKYSCLLDFTFIMWMSCSWLDGINGIWVNFFCPNFFPTLVCWIFKGYKVAQKQSESNLGTFFLIRSFSIVASDGDHLISLIDGISYKSPSAPMISQIEDIPPETFCHGDNIPPNCTTDCTCTHKIDVPLNAIVEVVLVDEGLYGFLFVEHILETFTSILFSATSKHLASISLAWIFVLRDWCWKISR